MLELLLWIISAYALSMLAVHLVHAWNQRRAKGPVCKRVVLITHNQQHQVEWVLRSLLFCNWLKGRHIELIVIDTGSSDLTMRIVSRLAERTPFYWQIAQTEAELQQALASFGEHAQIIDLSLHNCKDLLMYC